jgi:hypothetical protein
VQTSIVEAADDTTTTTTSTLEVTVAPVAPIATEEETSPAAVVMTIMITIVIVIAIEIEIVIVITIVITIDFVIVIVIADQSFLEDGVHRLATKVTLGLTGIAGVSAPDRALARHRHRHEIAAGLVLGRRCRGAPRAVPAGTCLARMNSDATRRHAQRPVRRSMAGDAARRRTSVSPMRTTTTTMTAMLIVIGVIVIVIVIVVVVAMTMMMTTRTGQVQSAREHLALGMNAKGNRTMTHLLQMTM